MIFKYIDKWGEHLLRDKRIKITHPRDFNDPFEFLPRISEVVTLDQIEEKLSAPSFLDNWFDSKISKGEVQSRAEFDSWLTNNRSAIKETLFKVYSESDYAPHDFTEVAGKKFGVTCFSCVFDDILMWSHYADKHQGLVIGFNASEFGPLLKQVDYCAERQEYHPVFAAERPDAISRTLLRKSTHWSYENERRLIVPWGLCIDDAGMKFLSFNANAIQRVILGCRAPDALGETIREILRKDFPSVTLEKMQIDDRQYLLQPQIV